ncbi:hypothetical protein D9613_001476 [Agrocybe pediades]|uniref:Uncharacterized protein n=1 Tax=Agrocybe pediades TaxID=84607 RepID=A0A8H4R5H9_9AGAR|nr:hypothetical protein D9613_001476 [Agrocybe pediades]
MIRPTFGITGSKWFIALRGVVGINPPPAAATVYYMAELMNIMFTCVFGYKYKDWNPAMPTSAGTDAKTILNYFLAWTVSLPFAMLHPSKLRIVFTIRVVLAFAAFFTMFVWCTALGQNDPAGFKGFNILQEHPISGSALGWATMSAINSILATTAPMITNQSDVSRYAKTPKDAGWPQGFTIFVTKVTMAFFSIIAAASLQSRYGGEAKWNIWDQLALLLEQNWNAATRCGCFVIAFGVAYSVMVTNVYCNSVPFGADIAALWPRYFNIVRGQIFITLISLPVLPWQILANAQDFLTFLGSYTFLMGALLGCQWGDFIVRKGNYHVPSIYNTAKKSIYMYTERGYNWRGFAAWGVSFCLIFPGLVAAYIPDKMSVDAQRIYSMGWIISVPLSGVCYYVFNKFFPMKIVPEEHAEDPAVKKWLGLGPIDGIFPGESVGKQESPSPESDSSNASIAEDEKKESVTVYSVMA